MKTNYYELELDDMVIELNNKDSVIEELEAELSDAEEKIALLEAKLRGANQVIRKYLKKEIDEILGEVKWKYTKMIIRGQ